MPHRLQIYDIVDKSAYLRQTVAWDTRNTFLKLTMPQLQQRAAKSRNAFRWKKNRSRKIFLSKAFSGKHSWIHIVV